MNKLTVCWFLVKIFKLGALLDFNFWVKKMVSPSWNCIKFAKETQRTQRLTKQTTLLHLWQPLVEGMAAENPLLKVWVPSKNLQ